LKNSLLTLLLCGFILLTGAAEALCSPAGDARLDEIEEMIDEGWWADAEKELIEVIGRNGNSVRAHHLLADIYVRELNRGRRMHWDEAEEHAKKTVELDGANVENLMLLGHVMGIKARDGSKLKAVGRAKTSKGSYERAIELEPDNLRARIWLVNFHRNAPGFAGGDKDEARRQAEAIAMIDPVEGHYSNADIYELLENDFRKAELELKAAIALNPEESKPYYMYADFCSRRDMIERAESLMVVLSAIEPSASGPFFSIGSYHEKAERWDDAVLQYEKLAAVDSTRQQALMRLGSLYQGQEQWDEALSNFELCFREDPDYYYALYEVGKTNLIGEVDLARAEAAFNEYIGGRIRGFWPSKADAYWRLAMVYDAQGERKKAKAALKEAKKIDSEHKQAKKLYKNLKRR
jgi:tetratricopeptide (TPR) repeat protein